MKANWTLGSSQNDSEDAKMTDHRIAGKNAPRAKMTKTKVTVIGTKNGARKTIQSSQMTTSDPKM